MSNDFQQRDMSGVLFKNDKGDNAKRPDYRGDICINGESFELSAWIKEGRKGKFMSLSAKPKDARQEQRAPAQQAPSRFDEDDVPF